MLHKAISEKMALAHSRKYSTATQSIVSTKDAIKCNYQQISEIDE